MKTQSYLLQASLWPSVLGVICLVFPGAVPGEATPPTTDDPPPNRAEAIPWSQLAARAGANYRGDGLAVSPIAMGNGTGTGARLCCVFQRLEGQATAEGLWLASSAGSGSSFSSGGREARGEWVTNEGFRVLATAVRRQPVLAGPSGMELSRTGKVDVADQRVRFIRPGLVEEYTLSMEGVRQDFVVEQKPPGEGQLRVELAVTGAMVEPSARGAQVVLIPQGGTERRIAYSRLKVTDANGKELPARMEVQETSAFGLRPSAFALAVVVDDAQAIFPIRIDPTFSDANWMSLGGFPGADNTVRAAVADGSGNVYVGGDFILAGDVVANHIAKWNGSNWSALGSGMNGSVGALAVSGGDVYAGGFFTTAGGVSATNIARWNGSSWSALGSGMNDGVYALAVSGVDVYAGGGFTTAGGSAASRIARWNGNSWSALGSGIIGAVFALAVSGSDLYAGGLFTTADGVSVPAAGIAKWNGTNWSALGSGISGPSGYPYYGGTVSALAVLGGDLYAGGAFTTAGGVSAANIARWNGSGWSALGAGMNATVSALAVSGSDLYVGGTFTTAGGSLANHIAKWDGSNWSALGSGLNGFVYALAVSGSDLYAGGSFTAAGGVPANYLAKWDGSGWNAPNSDWGMNDRVLALAVLGGDLYAGGFFTTAGTASANGIAKWNGSSWGPLGPGLNTDVYALAPSGENLYVGRGIPGDSVAKWDGSSWIPLGSGMNSEVRALVVSGGDLYAGGGFTAAGGVPANYIAKWDGSSWSSLGSGMGGQSSFTVVYALAVSGSNLYAGGVFTRAGGRVSRNAAWALLGDAPGYNQLAGTLLSGGAMQFSYTGYPATNYALDRAFNLAPPIGWVGQQTNTMTVSGILTFTDTPVPGTNNFWRVRSVP